MAQKMTGALVFDERTDRYDIRFDLNSYYERLNCSPFGVLGTRYIQIQYLPFHRSSRKRTQAFFRPSCPGFRYSQGLCLECF